ncbi:MAG: gliding motility-associated C-terminal domain-containing protein [Bacteroidales bacterium]|nr:gliding motility-associated C-terminal domain-containing protein [Bacteroidales bacterium]
MKKTTFYYAILIIASIVFAIDLKAQSEFVENKGQWNKNVRYKMELHDGALFLEDNCITYNFINPDEMNYSAAHHGAEGSSNSLLKSAHAYKMKFINANDSPDIIVTNASKDYNNYYIGNDQSKWASHAKKYVNVSYHNVYSGINIDFHAHKNSMKYDIILKPGANLNDILFEYVGADLLSIENGNLIISTTVNTVTELKPYAYQIFDGDTIEITCNYVLKRNRISFELTGNYEKTKDLIIDPSLVFSTYSGSLADNWGFTATYDYKDNVYSGGIVFETGYPTTIGAYQMNFAGGTPPIPGNSYYAAGCDIGIIKYNEDGTQRLFATYLGGAGGQEMPHSLVVTENNDLLIMGTTGSPDFPVSANAFQSNFAGGTSIVYDNVIGFGGGVDIFVTKISEDGSQMLGSTYIGGSGNDGLNYQLHLNDPDPNTGINYILMHGNDSLYYNYGDGARGEIIVDDKDMVYVGTNTFSNNFPAGINPGFQPTSGGKQDGIVFKLNKDLSLMLWSSYLGGTEDDAIFSLSLTEDGNVIVAGGAVSTNFPVTAGAYNTTHNGGTTDGFVAKINQNGNQLLASTYFGSNTYDNAYFVRTDRYNNIFICGQTKASGTTLIQNAAYSVPNSGQFITKFNNSLSDVVWSTVFGTGNGRPNISITAFAVDVCDRVYLSGWGREWAYSYYNAQGNYYTWADQYGTKGLQLTSDAIQTATDGQDFYVLVLNEDASNLEYASFFGEVHYASCGYSGHDHVDGGTSRFDKKGNIIQSVCSSCGGCQEFPTYPAPGVWSTSNNAANCNNAVFKIRIIENLAEANFEPVPIGCAPYQVQFNNNSQGTTFQWNFGDGSPISNALNPSHLYTQGGTYTVSLIVGDPASCNFYDTITRIITVVEPGQTNLPDIEICPNEHTLIGPSGSYPSGTTFNWVEGSNLNNYYIQNPIASPNVTTDYLLIANGVCIDSTWQRVIVYEPDIDIFASNDTLICDGDAIQLFAGSNGMVNTWQWSSSPSFTNTLSNTTQLLVTPSTNTTYYVRAQENICNTFVTEQVTVSVHHFNYNLNPEHIICLGETINLTLTNYNSNDQLSYIWSPTSQILSGADSNSPLVEPSSNTTFYVTITNQIGCVTTDQVLVTIDNIMLNSPSVAHNPCFGDCTGTINISASGIAPYSFEWNNGATGNQISDLCVGTYTVTVIDNLGCTATSTVLVNQPTELLADFTNVVVPECDGVGYGSATVDVNGGTPPYTYHWGFGGNQSYNNECLIGTNFVTVTDANNCKTFISIYMPSPGTLTSTLDSYSMIKCYGQCDGHAIVSAELGTPPYIYNWSNEQHTPEIHNLCAGPYTVTILDVDNCVSHQYIYINQPDTLITQAVIADEILCHGEFGDIILQTTGGTQPYTYQWSNGSNNNQLNGVAAGQYSITLTDANNCIEYSNVLLPQPEKIMLNITTYNMLCDNVCNGKIYSNVSGGTLPYHYSWSNGSLKHFADKLCEGDYELILKDANNCAIAENFTIANEGYVPDLAADANKYEVFEGEEVKLIAKSSMNGTYQWNNEQYLNNSKIANPIAILKDSTLFKVSFRDENNCIATDTVYIRVKKVICGDPYVYVPNAFTPNGDGNNDYFKPYYPLALVTELYFAVYDRWGNAIFETTDINSSGWDGTYKGESLATDVYVFWLKARCLNGEVYNHKGNVTLLR